MDSAGILLKLDYAGVVNWEEGLKEPFWSLVKELIFVKPPDLPFTPSVSLFGYLLGKLK